MSATLGFVATLAEMEQFYRGDKAGQIIDWLKTDHDLGHGHAMALVAWFKGKRS